MTNGLFDIAGKKAIVAGGGRGLGHGMAEALLESGCDVAIIGSSDRTLEAAAAFRERGFACHGAKGDFRKRDEVIGVFDESLALLGGDVDIFVSAAGVQRRAMPEDFPLDAWDEVLDVNLNAVFIQCQLAGRAMLPKGYGKIIIVGSLTYWLGGHTIPAYAASKGGVTQLARALSNDWFGRGVNVNVVAPGYMATEMNAALVGDPKRNAELTARIPAGRWGTPGDVKGVTLFLASHASDYVGGAVIPVDGGFISR